MVHIGFCSLDLHFPACQSLKDKRMILKSLKDRLRNRYNIALAEEDHTELWQRSRLALVTVGNDRQMLINLFEKIVVQIEDTGTTQVLASNTEYF